MICTVMHIMYCYAYYVQYNGKDISWQHVQDLYYKDSKRGVRLVPKLKYELVHLNSFSKMHVDLAAQVSYYCIVY